MNKTLEQAGNRFAGTELLLLLVRHGAKRDLTKTCQVH